MGEMILADEEEYAGEQPHATEEACGPANGCEWIYYQPEDRSCPICAMMCEQNRLLDVRLVAYNDAPDRLFATPNTTSRGKPLIRLPQKMSQKPAQSPPKSRPALKKYSDECPKNCKCNACVYERYTKTWTNAASTH